MKEGISVALLRVLLKRAWIIGIQGTLSLPLPSAFPNPNTKPKTTRGTRDRKNRHVAFLTRTQVMVALLTPPRMKACCHDRPAAKHPSSGKTRFQRKGWPRWRSVPRPGMQPGFDLALLDQSLADTCGIRKRCGFVELARIY